MSVGTAKEIFLKDYTQPDFFISETQLTFTLTEDLTTVMTILKCHRNGDHRRSLILVGEDICLKGVFLNQEELSDQHYQVNDKSLTISELPEEFELKTLVEIEPQNNTSLEGLYKSNNMFCTQCEAEGFRKITYYLDRPDVLSVFTTTIIADQKLYPILLSNGNLTDSGVCEPDQGEMHFASWHDPFPKPSYLFALVAGNLHPVKDRFVTMSGRDVAIELFVEEKDLDKCSHAIASLKNAMRWDEEVYGREYDLDIYMIVAVDSFNMGAMENKGLNIFNTSCVLANPLTTTDQGFQRVEAVVAHEYFHNWSGNRVTCRDWFQLSLKEGFTVFRDAEFSADMGSRAVKRAEDVQLLQNHQFLEDAGPMSHPVQPASFIEISNFYTLTVYEKGAEVVRMIHTLLGADLFRKGSDLYFERHDGQAVTIEDFVAAMADVSGRDFSRFMNWYRQAGTPQLDVKGHFDPDAKEYTLSISQSCPDTPEAKSEEKQAFHIPFALSLLGEAGSLRLDLKGQPSEDTEDNTQTVLELFEQEQSFTFTGIQEQPVPSLLRGFSAPVKLKYQYSIDDLKRIMENESDGYAAWNASQKLGLKAIDQVQTTGATDALDILVLAFRNLVSRETLDPAMVALMLELPSENYIGEQQKIIMVEQNHSARQNVSYSIAEQLKEELINVFERCNQALASNPSAVDSQSIALRSLKNCALKYLMKLPEQNIHQICLQQLRDPGNMTNELSALTSLVHSKHETLANEKELALKTFYENWQHEALVVNYWIAVQATSPEEQVLDKVEALYQSEIFDIKNPNKVRSLIGAFANQNLINFHKLDGSGYEFLANQIIRLNELNPQIASRLTTPLTRWKRYDQSRQDLMKTQLQRVLDQQDLSPDVYEVVTKSLVE